MRREVISVLLIAAMLLGGCSGYYQTGLGEAETSAVSEPSRENPAIGAAQGPGGGVPGTNGSTVEPPKIEGADSSALNPEIVIASDIHYLAKELTDFGEAFEEMAEHEEGKVVPYIWEITDAFLDEVVKRKPQALILSGDLTLQGELASHKALAQKLKRVERAGVAVLVIPGNHDINNSEASGYRMDSVSPAEQTTPEEFAEIYADYGYSAALSRDPESLSYIYELPDGTWLLMLDSCQYEDGAKIGGIIRTETYDWLDGWLTRAVREERNVIAVAHHNLLDECRIYEEDCTIEHAEQLEQFLSEGGVTLFLSGHLHAQHYRTSQYYDLNEIVTGSLATAPCQYGVLKYFNPTLYDYHTEQVDVTSWAMRHDNPDTNLEDFDDYAKEFLREVFYEEAYSDLEEVECGEGEKTEMAEFYADLNTYFIAGRVIEIRKDAELSWGYMMWRDYNPSSIHFQYLNEILEDAVCDYNVFQRGAAGSVSDDYSEYTVRFPSGNDEAAEHFSLELSLPAGWSISAEEEEDVFELMSCFSKYYIYDGNGVCVGAVGYNAVPSDLGEDSLVPAAIYNQIALGNDYRFDVREKYDIISSSDESETALTDVYYSAVITGDGSEKNNKGIVMYDLSRNVYIAAEFEADALTDVQYSGIARSLAFGQE